MPLAHSRAIFFLLLEALLDLTNFIVGCGVLRNGDNMRLPLGKKGDSIYGGGNIDEFNEKLTIFLYVFDFVLSKSAGSTILLLERIAAVVVKPFMVIFLL